MLITFISFIRVGIFMLRILVQSLSASTARIQTANGKITGKFEIEDSLELSTSKQPISATITMRNRNESSPTRLDIRTANS